MGMDGESKLAAAMAMAGRVARACDVCGKERARWYCAADEAYLCEHCDGCVHNANPLSRRHERVRLAPNGAPMKIDRRSSSDTGTRSRKAEQPQPTDTDSAAPGAAGAGASPATQPTASSRHHRHGHHQGTWQRGYSKKRSRSGRRRTHSLAHLASAAPLLPDSDRKNVKQEPDSPTPAESQAAHEVPNFLPEGYLELPVVSMSTDICFNDVHPLSWLNPDDSSPADEALDFLVPDGNQQGQGFEESAHDECLHSGDPLSQLDTGMGTLMDDGTMMLSVISGMAGMDNLGVLDLCPDRDDLTLDFSDIGALNCASTQADIPAGPTVQTASPFRLFARAKTEYAEYDQGHDYEQRNEYEQQTQHDYKRQPQQQVQQYQQQEQYQLYPDIQVPKVELGDILGCSLDELRKDEKWSGPSLRLNYEDVLNAWSERGMSWADSRCPQTVPEDSNGESAVSSDVGIVPDLGSSVHQSGEAAMGGADDGCTGGGREARVMRYREKRRTRLFSKKIRYEVRKLNAERRPRMKGRFVKRTGL